MYVQVCLFKVDGIHPHNHDHQLLWLVLVVVVASFIVPPLYYVLTSLTFMLLLQNLTIPALAPGRAWLALC